MPVAHLPVPPFNPSAYPPRGLHSAAPLHASPAAASGSLWATMPNAGTGSHFVENAGPSSQAEAWSLASSAAAAEHPPIGLLPSGAGVLAPGVMHAMQTGPSFLRSRLSPSDLLNLDSPRHTPPPCSNALRTDSGPPGIPASSTYVEEDEASGFLVSISPGPGVQPFPAAAAGAYPPSSRASSPAFARTDGEISPQLSNAMDLYCSLAWPCGVIQCDRCR